MLREHAARIDAGKIRRSDKTDFLDTMPATARSRQELSQTNRSAVHSTRRATPPARARSSAVSTTRPQRFTIAIPSHWARIEPAAPMDTPIPGSHRAGPPWSKSLASSVCFAAGSVGVCSLSRAWLARHTNRRSPKIPSEKTKLSEDKSGQKRISGFQWSWPGGSVKTAGVWHWSREGRERQ